MWIRALADADGAESGTRPAVSVMTTRSSDPRRLRPSRARRNIRRTLLASPGCASTPSGSHPNEIVDAVHHVRRRGGDHRRRSRLDWRALSAVIIGPAEHLPEKGGDTSDESVSADTTPRFLAT